MLHTVCQRELVALRTASVSRAVALPASLWIVQVDRHRPVVVVSVARCDRASRPLLATFAKCFAEFEAEVRGNVLHRHTRHLLGWLIEECRRFCQATGRDALSAEDQAVLMAALEDLDWKSLGNFSRNRDGLLRALRDTLGGGLVTPLPGVVAGARIIRKGEKMRTVRYWSDSSFCQRSTVLLDMFNFLAISRTDRPSFVSLDTLGNFSLRSLVL